MLLFPGLYLRSTTFGGRTRTSCFSSPPSLSSPRTGWIGLHPKKRNILISHCPVFKIQNIGINLIRANVIHVSGIKAEQVKTQQHSFERRHWVVFLDRYRFRMDISTYCDVTWKHCTPVAKPPRSDTRKRTKL